MILVEVYVPAADEKFDFELDENARVYQIVGELCEMLGKKMKSPVASKTGEFMLCSMEQNVVLSGDNTLYQCKIRDGSKLLLV